MELDLTNRAQVAAYTRMVVEETRNAIKPELPPKEDQKIPISKASELTGIPAPTIYYWCKMGFIGCRGMGTKYYVTKKEVETYAFGKKKK
jgi:hypothetical protein